MQWLAGGLQLASSEQQLLRLGMLSPCVSDKEHCVCSELGYSLSLVHLGVPPGFPLALC